MKTKIKVTKPSRVCFEIITFDDNSTDGEDPFNESGQFVFDIQPHYLDNDKFEFNLMTRETYCGGAKEDLVAMFRELANQIEVYTP